jgi:hypothetical protein
VHGRVLQVCPIMVGIRLAAQGKGVRKKMEERRHGRFFAQELPVESGANLMELIQEALDDGDRKEWHLVGVSDVPEETLQ